MTTVTQPAHGLVQKLRESAASAHVGSRIAVLSAGTLASIAAAQALDHPIPVLAAALIPPVATALTKYGIAGVKAVESTAAKVAVATGTVALGATVVARLAHLDDNLLNTTSYEFAREIVTHSPEHLGIAVASVGASIGINAAMEKIHAGYEKLKLFSRGVLSTALIAGTVLIGASYGPRLPAPQNDKDTWNIAYTQKFDAGVRAADPKQVEKVVGIEVNSRAQAAYTSIGPAIIYKRESTDSASTARIAEKHQRLFTQNGYFITATPIRGADAQSLYKLSFGKGPKKRELENRKARIQTRLGTAFSLDIERAADGEYLLVGRQSLPQNQALYLADKTERDLWGLHEGKRPLRVEVTAERNRLQFVPRARSAQQFAWVDDGLVQNNIQASVQTAVRELRAQGILPQASEAQLGIAIYSHTRNGWVALYDADTPRLLGSMAKAPVAFAYEQGIACGYLPKPNPLSIGWKRLRHEKFMLWTSSNVESNRFMDEFGGPSQTTNLLQQWYPEIFKGIHIVERIPDEGENNGRTYKNTITPRANTAMHASIYKGLVANDGMQETLQEGLGVNWPFGLVASILGGGGTKLLNDSFPEETHIDNKTGTTGMNSADGGTITTPKQTYSITIQLDRATAAEDYGAWRKRSKQGIQALSYEVYRLLNDQE